MKTTETMRGASADLPGAGWTMQGHPGGQAVSVAGSAAGQAGGSKRSSARALRTALLSGVVAGSAALALGGCSSAPPLFTSDGRATQQISCTSTDGGNWTECQRRAQAACGSGGYDTLSQQSGTPNTMVIACKRPPAQY